MSIGQSILGNRSLWTLMVLMLAGLKNIRMQLYEREIFTFDNFPYLLNNNPIVCLYSNLIIYEHKLCFWSSVKFCCFISTDKDVLTNFVLINCHSLNSFVSFELQTSWKTTWSLNFFLLSILIVMIAFCLLIVVFVCFWVEFYEVQLVSVVKFQRKS